MSDQNQHPVFRYDGLKLYFSAEIPIEKFLEIIKGSAKIPKFDSKDGHAILKLEEAGPSKDTLLLYGKLYQELHASLTKS